MLAGLPYTPGYPYNIFFDKIYLFFHTLKIVTYSILNKKKEENIIEEQSKGTWVTGFRYEDPKKEEPKYPKEECPKKEEPKCPKKKEEPKCPEKECPKKDRCKHDRKAIREIEENLEDINEAVCEAEEALAEIREAVCEIEKALCKLECHK